MKGRWPMVIWKYELRINDTQKIKMPRGAKGLDVQWQFDKLCMWVLCDENNITEDRVIAIYGTGHHLPMTIGTYVGTFQMEGGNLVFHVFLV
jgi:hypothetical protein